jgi:nicotinate-nucleotide adenylyltransferase
VRDVARLGVFGGTFDPPHRGHLFAASAALDAFALDRVLFVPAARPWQKSDYSNPEDRFQMTVLAAAVDDRFAVSRVELDRSGPTYTADTLMQLRDWHGGDIRLFFIAGTDVLEKLDTWKKLKSLRDLVEFICVARPAPAAPARPREAWPKVHRLDLEGLDISSTEVRKRIAEGGPVSGVPDQVLAYIRARNLYRGGADG